MVTKAILSIVFLNICQLALSQKEGNNWYFGWKAGITFNTNPPSALNNGQMSTVEGCATISTPEGRLLFYTDGISVWDSNHVIMPNGMGLNGDSSTTQSAIIVPRPDSAHIYYIFTLDDQHGSDGLHYSVVNMKLNTGKGAIVSGEKNIWLKNSMCEKITAVQHENQHDFWVLAPQYGSDSFFVYSITNAGLNKTPMGYKTGFTITGNDVSHKVGYLKISPDRKKIAYANVRLDSTAVGDFDASTGMISNLWRFYTPWSYGVEFSAGTKFLYIGEYVAKKISQYDLSSSSRSAFIASRKVIDSAYSNIPGALQLGPDGKIYIVVYASPYLSVIHVPDSSGFNCKPQKNYLSLASRVGRLGLPNSISSFMLKSFYVTGKCGGDSTFFKISDTYKVDSVQWDFGDPGSGIYNTSDKTTGVYHIYQQAGNYEVSLLSYYQTFRDRIKVRFRVSDPVKPYLGNDTTVCNSFALNLTPQNNYRYRAYQWTGNGRVDSIVISQKGTYILIAIDSAGCRTADTIQVHNPQVTALFSLSDTMMCFTGHAFTINDTSIYTDDKRLKSSWYFGDSKSKTDTSVVSKTYDSAGTYSIQLVLQSQSACMDSTVKKIAVLPSVTAAFDVNKDTQCFQNNEFDFFVRTAAKNYLWDFGDGNKDTVKTPKYRYGLAGNYKVFFTAFDTSICKSKDSVLLTLLAPIIQININKDTQCFQNHEFLFYAIGNVKTYEWNFGDGISDSLKSPKHKYAKQGKYPVNVKSMDSHSCVAFDSAFVILIRPSAQWTIDNDTQCLKNNEFKFDASGGKINYIWNFGSGNPASGQRVWHRYALAGKYTIILTTTDSFSCRTDDTMMVLVLQNPVAGFSYTLNDCISEVQFSNQSVNYTQSSWEIDFSTFYAKDVNYHFKLAGQYLARLTVKDSGGLCADTLEKVLVISTSKKLEPLFIPNVFTPGNDNMNDCYHLGGLDATCGDEGDIWIYNRWGLLVFHGNVATECWNGKQNNNGSELSAGAYYYLLKLKYYNENGVSEVVTTKGVIHLIR